MATIGLLFLKVCLVFCGGSSSSLFFDGSVCVVAVSFFESRRDRVGAMLMKVGEEV